MAKIVYLYKDLLGLYGEYANIDALVKRLAFDKIKAEVELVDFGDKLDLQKADLLYVGAGTEGRMLAALSDFSEKKDAVNEYIQGGGLVLATGNSLSLFCDRITANDSEEYRGIGAANATVQIDDKRRYGEFIMNCSMSDDKIIGSINTSLTVSSSEDPVFNVEFSSAKILTSKTEGVRKNNLFLTQLVGPLLVRNPSLLDWFAKKTSKKELSVCTEDWYKYMVAGYEHVLDTLQKAAEKKR